MNAFTESVVEQAALDWFRALGYDVVGGPDMPPGPHALRESYADTIFPSVVRGALDRLNPNLPAEALDDAFRKLTHPEGATLEVRNRAFHRLAVDGVTVEYRDDGGAIRGAQVQVLDFEQPSNNDWLAVNQFTVVEGSHERCPDIVLSDEFLAEVRDMPQRNLAVELLQKLLKGELAVRRRKNVVQARSFAEMLEQTLRRYQNRAVEAAQVIEELIRLAREMREANARGEQLGLSEDELAFYDALETNDSAVQVLGDETLRDIARELVDTVCRNVTIDWTLRENVRANLRRLVRRILRKHGYPPDKQEKATRTVLEQAEALSAGWAA